MHFYQYHHDTYVLFLVHVQETGFVKPVSNIPYTMSPGYALIIHNKYFPNKEQPLRHGSEKDVEAIENFCNLAGLTINDTDRKTKDLTATQMEELCTEISKRDFSRYKGFVCFILSHGSENGIYGTDDVTISVQEIVSKFKYNSGLVGKPKLFFIQACRGNNKDSGVDSDSQPVGRITPLRLPSESDVLIAYSSVEGYESYRSPLAGSWFICTLMEQLKAHAHNMHLMDILTLVNQQIAGYETPSGEKQMSCQMSTLTKFVYFKIPPPFTP